VNWYFKIRKGNQKWTIQRTWQHRTHTTKTNKTKTQHNIHWTPQVRNLLAILWRCQDILIIRWN